MSQHTVRRIVTGHDASGRAVVTHDTRLTGRPTPTGESTLLWTSVGLPVDNDDAADGSERKVGLTLPGGTVLRLLEMLPGRRSSMHRTDSLDYGIVLSGTAELELDDAVITQVHAGDIVVQRGTIHAWRNPSEDTLVRIAFVLVDARSATVDGEPLPPIMPGPARTGG